MVTVGLIAYYLAANVTIHGVTPRFKSTQARAEMATLREVLGMVRGSSCDGWDCDSDDLGLGDDPWGRPWIYEVTGKKSFRIRSLGADGRPDGTGEDADLSSDEL